MIRPIDIKLNAAHPELPLVEATTFTGSPSSVFIHGVPKNCGNWSITAVNVAVTYPDNSTTTRAAVESAEGVWVATIPGTATSGRTTAGFRILADGIDENGAAVTGYVLGFADFSVLSFFPVPAPGETFFYLQYFDTMPTAAKKMDVTTIDGILKYYNGTAWLPFTDLSNYYTKAETDNAIERVAAYYITYNAAGAAFPTRADLINATTYYSGGVVRVPTRNDYAVVLADETHDGAEWRYIYAVPDGETTGQWEAQYPVEGVIAYDNTVTPTSGSGVKSSGIWSAIWGALSALPAGFTSLYDWCAAQFAKYLPLTGGTLAGTLTLAEVDGGNTEIIKAFLGSTSSQKFVIGVNGGDFYIGQYGYRLWLPYADGTLAILENLAGNFSSSTVYAKDALVVYSNALYRCVNPNGHTGRWAEADFTPATVEDVLAALRTGKLDKSGGTMTGELHFAGQDLDGCLGLAYDGENHRLVIVDNWNENMAYLEVPNTADGSRVAFTSDVNNAIAAIPYDLGTPIVIDTASSETVEGETVYFGAATLANRTANIVQVTATLDELRITFPAATSGKVRDFGLRVEIGTGSAALAAPALVPIAPTGETIKIENNAAEIPALADGTATAKGVTLLYFSENAPEVFVVKGEQVEEVL